jgi:hypothetical protein
MLPCKRPDCGAEFYTAQTRLHHGRTAHRDGRFACLADGCGRTFGTRTTLENHGRSGPV